MLSCTADGVKLSLMVIFKQKTLQKNNFPVVGHRSAPKRIDGPRRCNQMDKSSVGGKNEGIIKKHSMVVWDQFRTHPTKKVKRSLKSNTVQAVIPDQEG